MDRDHRCCPWVWLDRSRCRGWWEWRQRGSSVVWRRCARTVRCACYRGWRRRHRRRPHIITRRRRLVCALHCGCRACPAVLRTQWVWLWRRRLACARVARCTSVGVGGVAEWRGVVLCTSAVRRASAGHHLHRPYRRSPLHHATGCHLRRWCWRRYTCGVNSCRQWRGVARPARQRHHAG